MLYKFSLFLCSASLSSSLLQNQLKNSCSVESCSSTYPLGDKRNCFLGNGVSGFEALPGGGWDGLQNLDLGQIMHYSYSQCKTTEDGKYLIPDHTFTIPIKTSSAHLFTEVFDHWSQYQNMDSFSIGVDASIGIPLIVQVSASFSFDYQYTKKTQYEEKSFTRRVQLRHNLYNIKVQPDPPLAPAFKNRLLEVGAHLQSNNTQLASYLSQLIVRDFGTHYIRSVDVGAAIAQEDNILRTSVSDSEKKSIGVRYSVGGGGFIEELFVGAKLQAAFQTNNSFSDKMARSLTNRRIKTLGGPNLGVNMTLGDWEAGISNNLVAVDRSGDPLYFAITEGSLPELPDPLRVQVIGEIQTAVQQYYKFNTYTGCTNQDSPNFSYKANVDDKSCKAPPTNSSFGGIYQSCSSQGNVGDICAKEALYQKNPLTGDYSCPKGYDSVLLHSATTVYTFPPKQTCITKEVGWWFTKHPETKCTTTYYKAEASYETYWCAARGAVNQNSGFLFGGVHSSHKSNPNPASSGKCPPHYYSLQFGTDAKVCVTDDYELGLEYSVPFSGFFSCRTGNPLALKHSDATRGKRDTSSLSSYLNNLKPESWPKACPHGYSQHLAILDEGCEIDYCIKTGQKNAEMMQAHRPPFIKLPTKNPHTTKSLFIFGVNGEGWAKDPKTNSWKTFSYADESEMSAAMNSLSPAQRNLVAAMTDINGAQPTEVDANATQATNSFVSTGATVGISIGVTAFVGLVIVGVFIGLKQQRRKKREREEGLRDNILPSNEHQYGTVGDHSSNELSEEQV